MCIRDSLERVGEGGLARKHVLVCERRQRAEEHRVTCRAQRALLGPFGTRKYGSGHGIRTEEDAAASPRHARAQAARCRTQRKSRRASRRGRAYP
eukprot:3257619-Rhodomonas_salina.3